MHESTAFDDPEVRRALARYRLARPAARAMRQRGELLGRATGSSREFQDYREYQPGDDPRHIDWAAYGRSDTPMVRLFRDEISPRLQILLDGSRSMASGSADKPRLARQLTGTLASLAMELGDRPRTVLLDDERPARIARPPDWEPLAALTFEGRTPLGAIVADRAVPPARHTTRVVISDFLFPHDPRELVSGLTGDATALIVIQLLARSEADPPRLGGRRLVDVETGEFDDQRLDEETIALYKQRLAVLQDGLADQSRRLGAVFLSAVAEDGLDAICRDRLCSAGVLQPA